MISEVLIVPQTVVSEVIRHCFAVLDRIIICVELKADAVSHRNDVFHIEKNFCMFDPRFAGL